MKTILLVELLFTSREENALYYERQNSKTYNDCNRRRVFCHQAIFDQKLFDMLHAYSPALDSGRFFPQASAMTARRSMLKERR